jgi:hypothetical protein
VSLKLPIGFDVWRHRVRSLTRFITLGRVQVPVVGVFDTGVVSVSPGGTVDTLTVPSGEVWLITSVKYDRNNHICVAIHDGVNTSICPNVIDYARIGGSATFASVLVPVSGGWVIRFRNTHSSNTLRARATGLKLDPSVVTVIGGVIPVAGGSYGSVVKPVDGNYFYMFLYGQTVGDGAWQGHIYHCGISGCLSVASTYYYAEWIGTADHPHSLVNYPLRNANFLLLGLGVRVP